MDNKIDELKPILATDVDTDNKFVIKKNDLTVSISVDELFNYLRNSGFGISDVVLDNNLKNDINLAVKTPNKIIEGTGVKYLEQTCRNGCSFLLPGSNNHRYFRYDNYSAKYANIFDPSDNTESRISGEIYEYTLTLYPYQSEKYFNYIHLFINLTTDKYYVISYRFVPQGLENVTSTASLIEEVQTEDDHLE